jgi:hypothetical protein
MLMKILSLFIISCFLSSPVLSGDHSTFQLRQKLLYDLETARQNSHEPLSRVNLIQVNAESEKSVLKAVALSLLLPGMGELYADGFESGKYFLIAETGLWLTYTGFEAYGHWLQNDARSFAARHASVTVDGKDDQFFIDIGNFLNVYEYNEKKLRDRDPARLYNPNGPYFWQWDTDASRARFRDLRVKSDNVLNNVRFVVGAIIVNHIASAINAARLASRWNRELSKNGWQIEPRFIGQSLRLEGVGLTLRKSL